jgi:hypothetical protein
MTRMIEEDVMILNDITRKSRHSWDEASSVGSGSGYIAFRLE